MPLSDNTTGRRQFISTAAKATCGLALLQTSMFANAGNESIYDELTVQDIIDRILKEVPGAPFSKTVDTIKSGNASNKVKGIVTTMFATVPVIQKTIQSGANFIIAHEPTFYNHNDDINWVENNSVVSEKQKLLNDNNITVWRFHDYWHAVKPDGITYGVVKKAGWTNYYQQGQLTLAMPAQSLKNIALHLKNKLGIKQVRVIGDLNRKCERIALLPGAWGGQMQIKTAETEKPDLVIVGEVHEWETAEYIRDARALGHNVSLIILGHSLSEEPGMDWLVDWLKPKIPGIKVTHIPSNDPFLWL